MSASITDTAELPVALAAPVGALDATPPASEALPSGDAGDRADRRQVRAERRKARRARRLFTLGGLAVLAAFLSATIAVLGAVR